MPGWQQGVLVAVALTVVGALALRALVRRQVPWWPSVAGALLLFGPAVGLIVGAWAAGAPFFFGAAAGWPTNIGWGILVFVGATSIFGLVRSFLQSRLMTEEFGV